MKFLHLADLHIGKNLNGRSLLEDQEYILQQIVDIANNKKADAVLIAGDIYQNTTPSEEAVNTFDDFLRKLAGSGKAVYIISGNHDSDDRLNFGRTLFAKSRVFISSKFNKDASIDKYEFKDEHGTVSIFMLPFVKPSQVRSALNAGKEEIPNCDAAIKTLIERAEAATEERSILMLHQFAAPGSETTEEELRSHLAGSEEASWCGTLERIDTSSFRNFTYTALGHIHKPEALNAEGTIRYAGSPLKYSESEIDSVKSVPVVTIGPAGSTPQIECVPLKPLHDMREITGELSEVIRQDFQSGGPDDDYVYVTLTNEIPVTDAMNKLRTKYRNILGMDYQRKNESRKQAARNFSCKEKTLGEIMDAFYMQQLGGTMTDYEREIFAEAAKAAGFEEFDK